MGGKTIEERVETLENDMDPLRQLPAKVDDLGKRVSGVESRLTTVESQIVQLRTDMNDGFSATLQIVESSSKATKAMFDEMTKAIDIKFAETHRIITQGDQDTRTEMRVLHEDLVKRIAVLGEARAPRRKRS